LARVPVTTSEKAYVALRISWWVRASTSRGRGPELGAE
jgi:hypothetical protein